MDAKMVKFIGIIAVTLLVAVSLIGVGAAADGEYPGSGTYEDPWWCGEDTTGSGHASKDVYAWLEDQTLKISGTGDMYDYEDCTSVPWYNQRGNITSVAITDGVTSIGTSVFYQCNSLTSVKIGNGVTGIGDYAFKNSESLLSIDIPDSVKSIGNEAFMFCSCLSSVKIGSGVISIGDDAFNRCSSLTSVDIPRNVETIGVYAFNRCSSLTEFSVEEDNAFFSSQNGVLFNKNKTELIKYPIGNNAVSYTVPNGVIRIDSFAFEDCSSLKFVTLPDSIISIGDYAFYQCTNMTSVTIPKSVITIGTSAFSEMKKNSILYSPGNEISRILNKKYSDSNTAIATLADAGTNSYMFTIGDELSPLLLSEENAPILPGYKFVGWYDENGNIVTQVSKDDTSLFRVVMIKTEPSPESSKSSKSSSVTSFRGIKDGNDFTFTNAVVVTKATLLGATSARITNNGSGEGWYKCTLSTDGFNGEGTLYFQVPLDVIEIKGWTVNDVSLLGCPTSYLGTENQYVKYSAVITNDGTYTIGFEKDAAKTPSGTTTVTETKKSDVTLKAEETTSKVDTTPATTTKVDSSTTTQKTTGKTTTERKQTATKSPFPVLGILAGFGAAVVLVLKRK